MRLASATTRIKKSVIILLFHLHTMLHYAMFQRLAAFSKLSSQVSYTQFFIRILKNFNNHIERLWIMEECFNQWPTLYKQESLIDFRDLSQGTELTIVTIELLNIVTKCWKRYSKQVNEVFALLHLLTPFFVCPSC